MQQRPPEARVVKAVNLLAVPVLETTAWASSPVKPSAFYVSDNSSAGHVARELIGDAGFRPVYAGPLKIARQLEQVGVLLHQVALHESAGEADLVRLAVSVIEATPDQPSANGSLDLRSSSSTETSSALGPIKE